LSGDADTALVSGITRTYALGPPFALAATLVALVSPQACVAIFGALTAVYMFEATLFGRHR
jgi:hypothetical protein